MAKSDYNKAMLNTAQNNRGARLLLHCCCAPCSSACLERLKDYFKITCLFYNPNIAGEEYFKRKEELKNFLLKTGWADFLDCDRDEAAFLSRVKGLENCPEGGARCKECFYLRLQKTRDIALSLGYEFFTTTLTLSPLKNAELINEIGFELGGGRWLPSDFKKQNGYLRSLQLSKEYCLYRQNYCGCVYSQRGIT